MKRYIVLILDEKDAKKIPEEWIYYALIKEKSFEKVTDAVDQIQNSEGDYE